MTTSTRERRDWTLLIFIIPIGIILMLIAGQFAIRLVPIWSINAGMKSNLDPGNLPSQQSGLVQPVLPAILTPLGWFDTFLTPGADTGVGVAFPPFVVFEPTTTPVVTATAPPPTVITPPATIPVTDSPTDVVTPPVTPTKKPPVDTSTPPTATPPTATPPTATPPTATPPTATPPTATPPTATPPTVTPPTPTGTPSTPPVLSVLVPPPSPGLGVNATPDGTVGQLVSGTYTVINISSNPLYVSGTADGYYDLIFYEAISPTDPNAVNLDQISIGISNSADGSSYYEIFNWGDNITDTNTNVDTASLPADADCTLALGAPECDNRVIPTSELYTPNAGDPSIPQTGILIDVDNAPGAPPEGTYNYLVIISPLTGGLDPAQVDSVVVAEVPLSAGAVLAPVSNISPQSVEEAPVAPAEEPPPADSVPAAPVENPPATP